MRISTMSVVIGGTICNASCPFCVARMTPEVGVPKRAPKADWSNFPASIRYAEQAGASTILITGKGEPTLNPEDITVCLIKLRNSTVPFRELQTNGIVIAQQSKWERDSAWAETLQHWRELGLNNIALSIVSYDDTKNKLIYTPKGEYPALREMISFLRSFGFGVRLSCIMTKGNTDSLAEVQKLIEFAKANDAFQITLIPVTAPGESGDPEAYRYVKENNVDDLTKKLKGNFDLNGHLLLEMPHGAAVYDYQGQNVCLSNCLTHSTNPNTIRQLIYFSHDGSLRYSWEFEGARIL